MRTFIVTYETRLYVKIILSIFFSLTVKQPIIALALSGIFGLYYINKMICKKELNNVMRICVNLLVFQNPCIGVISHTLGYSDANLKYLSQIPFFIIVISGVLCIYYGKFINNACILKNTDICFGILLVVVFIFFLISDGHIVAKIINIRNYITFYFSYVIGEICINDKENMDKFVKYFLKLSLFVVLVGFVLWICPYIVWEKMGIHEVYIAKNAAYSGARIPQRFYTSVFGMEVFRMGSLYYEPINLSYFLAVAFVLSFSYPWTIDVRKRIMLIVAIGIGQVLTFGKGGCLISAIFVACYVGYRFIKIIGYRLSHKVIMSILICFCLCGVVLFALFYYDKFGGAVNVHFWAIEATYKQVLLNPWGHGLGRGGNAAAMYDNIEMADWLASGGETALMALIYQLGIAGGVIWVMCFVAISVAVSKNIYKISFARYYSFIPIALVCVSIFQDNTYTPQCITVFMLLAGCLSYDKGAVYERKNCLFNK